MTATGSPRPTPRATADTRRSEQSCCGHPDAGTLQERLPRNRADLIAGAGSTAERNARRVRVRGHQVVAAQYLRPDRYQPKRARNLTVRNRTCHDRCSLKAGLPRVARCGWARARIRHRPPGLDRSTRRRRAPQNDRCSEQDCTRNPCHHHGAWIGSELRIATARPAP